jgi:hypothetical protein
MDEKGGMLSREAVLVSFIEDHAEELTQNWLKIVRTQNQTRTYQSVDPQKLHDRAFKCFNHLARWVAREFSKGDIASYYTAEGAKRRREGYALAEVIRAFIVGRRVLWFEIQAEGMLGTVMNPDLALELNNRVVLFFDRAIYYTILGYEQK